MSPQPLHGFRPTTSSSATVGTQLTFSVAQPTLVALQVVAANDDGQSLTAHLDGTLQHIEEIRGPGTYARQHLIRCGTGTLQINYEATVTPGPGAMSQVDEAERMLMLRPSRFCPSDRMIGYSATRLPGPDTPPLQRIQAITDYVSAHLSYVGGSTGPTDDAVDVLLSGQGVCRDYAHLVVTLARAHDMAARLVTVYAPGLSPMDFHAVAEIEVDGVWHVVDATRLAPRESMVRISTGRDAADTAFATTLHGVCELTGIFVTAVADDGLPTDDGNTPTFMT